MATLRSETYLNRFWQTVVLNVEHNFKPWFWTDALEAG